MVSRRSTATPVRRRSIAVLALAIGGASCAPEPAPDEAVVEAVQPAVRHRGDGPGRDFVRRVGRDFHSRGRPLRVVGASNYYLMYKSRAMVDNVMNAAAASGFNTIRIWGALDIGNQDGSNSVSDPTDGRKEGVYFHYWDGNAPAFNEGADGLLHLDYVISKASQLNIRLIIPFVNNWKDFGGMDQYVRWRGGQFHDEFYTDPIIRTWYKEWIARLLNRVNSITGVAYKNDPTIMSWELANEPRCKSDGPYPPSPGCTTETLLGWADEMSRFVKTIDRRHLLGVGDEGFFCTPGATDWTENCGEGVDTLALADLPNIDVMSYHLYPDGWGKDAAWGTAWIERHIRAARTIRERALLGEFGLRDKATRNPVYKQWTDAVLREGGAGAMYWMLADKQDDGSTYPDYDGFTVYCPSPVCTTLSNFGNLLLRRGPSSYPPVADHDTAVTPSATAVTLNPTANDVTYGVALLPDSLDLDPAAPGQQTVLATAGGAFALQQPGGQVVFTPAAGFSGEAVASYVVNDAAGRAGAPALLKVTVQPDPDAPLRLFSFESGAQGWAVGNWQGSTATVAQSAAFASDGVQSLEVDVTSWPSGGWFGVTSSPALDLTTRPHLKFEVKTLGAGTSRNIAVKLGDSYSWCEGTWGWIEPNTTTTVEVDLLTLGCGITDLTKVQELYVWFSGGGVFYLDHVRAD